MFEKLAEKIKKAEKIAIFNHEHPDGDALGSAYALKLALMSLGKRAEVFMRGGDDKSVEYSLVSGSEPTGLEISDCDLKIAVDCAELARIGDISGLFTGNTACIDHHRTHIEFSDTTVVVADAPATGEIIYDLIRYMNITLTRGIANNLYIAIVCDTGNFKYASTSPKTMRTAAALMETGIDTAEISRKIFDTKTMEYLRLYAKSIDKLEIYGGGKIALLALTDEDFAAAGIDESAADGVVTLPRRVEGADVGVYIRQRGENEYKVSLRSNAETDVSAVAQKFGGGGHVRASGLTLKMPLDEAKRTIVKAIEEVMAVQ